MSNTYRVIADRGLNLRSAPYVRNNTRLIVLPFNHKLTLLENSEVNGWVMITTNYDGLPITGYVFKNLIEKVENLPIPEGYNKVTAVHFRENNPSNLRDSVNRASPIGEANRPIRKNNENEVTKRNKLASILDYLDVENNRRYAAGRNRTFCNIYAHDYCYLSDAYLPRVWWKDQALINLSNGIRVNPIYGQTIREMNVNSIYDWIEDWYQFFGWEREIDLLKLQEAANSGKIAIILAKNKDIGKSGHVSVVVPETDIHKAKEYRSGIFYPLQSHAGRRNEKYFTRRWWISNNYSGFSCWIHP